ncbi:MAG: class I SAM-dependent methyltransferase [Melioribacteraceae bacterium]|jgi:2-polyprenyl-3-methyl-5-hydroxy-6-metoxy-1,4-benzoquinol methylase|nr:class I SAM-dependent methyltransferase [Melioribacteraceae bacterium]
MAEKHFYEQRDYTEKYLIPYFQKKIHNFHKLKVLEIGCAEGGLLEVLRNLGMDATGIELSPERIEIAKAINPQLKIIAGDITDEKLPDLIGEKFDLIIMREVIEHVSNKYTAFDNLDILLNDKGYLFISFPPKYSPFAGHQQIAGSFLKAVPYLHLLPKLILNPVAKSLSEKDDYVEEIKLHYSTGMQIAKFETLCRLKNFVPVKKELFLFRPIYGYRYGLPKLKMPDIRFFREFYTFGYETLLRKTG